MSRSLAGAIVGEGDGAEVGSVVGAGWSVGAGWVATKVGVAAALGDGLGDGSVVVGLGCWAVGLSCWAGLPDGVPQLVSRIKHMLNNVR